MNSLALLVLLLITTTFALYECVMMTTEVIAELRARRRFAAWRKGIVIEMDAVIKSVEEHGILQDRN